MKTKGLKRAKCDQCGQVYRLDEGKWMTCFGTRKNPHEEIVTYLGIRMGHLIQMSGDFSVFKKAMGLPDNTKPQ